MQQQIARYFNEFPHQFEFDHNAYADEDDFYDENYDQEDTYPELEPTFAIARLLHPLDQQEVFWHVLTCAEAMEDETPMGSTPYTAEALAAYAEAARAIVRTSDERQAAWRRLLDVLDWTIGDDPDVVNAVHEAVGRLCDTPDDTRQLIACLQATDAAGFADWIAGYYLQLGDDAAYLSMRQAHLRTEAQHLELADYWLQHGKPDEARAVLEQYVPRLIEQMEQQQHDIIKIVRTGGVLERLEHAYRETGDDENLCRILLVLIRARGLDVEQYQQIKTLALSSGTWASVQPILLADARDDRQTLAHIYLLEEDWDAALQLAQQQSPYSFGDRDDVRALVALGVKAHRPQAALAILRPLVQSHIDKKNRIAYAKAAEYAAAIKAIYRNVLHDEAAWHTYITDIRHRYPRHNALQEELRGL